MSDVVILPCPFCGVTPSRDAGQWVIHPKADCSLDGWGFALAAWNRRATPSDTSGTKGAT